MVSSGRRDPPNGFAFEELSICSAENLSSDGRRAPARGRRNHWPTLAHPWNHSPLSAAMQSCGRNAGGTGSGFPWKSATIEFTNPTRARAGPRPAPARLHGDTAEREVGGRHHLPQNLERLRLPRLYPRLLQPADRRLAAGDTPAHRSRPRRARDGERAPATGRRADRAYGSRFAARVQPVVATLPVERAHDSSLTGDAWSRVRRVSSHLSCRLELGVVLSGGTGQQVIVEGFSGCAPAEGLAGAGVECERDGGQLVGAVSAEVGAAGEVLAEQAVGVFVRAALPGAVGVAEVDVDAGVDPQLGVLGHLRALIPGQRAS